MAMSSILGGDPCGASEKSRDDGALNMNRGHYDRAPGTSSKAVSGWIARRAVTQRCRSHDGVARALQDSRCVRADGQQQASTLW